MRADPSEVALTIASLILAASIAGSATRDVFVGAPAPAMEVASLRLDGGEAPRPGPERTIFAAGEAVTAWVETRGEARSWVTARWFDEEGVVVHEETRVVSGRTRIPFRLPARIGQAGTWRIEVAIDDFPAGARDFERLPR
jgi:hypothetical protein